MVAELAAIVVGVLALFAELLHARRIRRVALLAFGPSRAPRLWARFAPLLRTAALAATTWGLATLILIEPKVHRAKALDKNDLRHLVLLLDVSPSMRLEDAGPTKKEARADRVAALVDSFLERAPEPFRISVVAFYNGAKPVVVDTIDMEVVHNILNDLPMSYAFEVGQTKLFDGLEEVARTTRGWEPHSTTLLVLTDGDTVPATGMPKMPAAVSHVAVVGVGDARAGSFIDGRQSRQDASTLRQVAARLGGTYHNGNEKQIPTDLLNRVTQTLEDGAFSQLTRREYALMACGAGATTFALLPLALFLFGTAWRPGVRTGVRPDSPASPVVGRKIDTQLAGSLR
jgi:Ca-activated chloride channel family protein